MLKQAKMKLRQLFIDDSGIAMAYTIVAFLFFFLLCMSVYAMAENVRRKMELQNACDAAAYSGAVVQADMLSRIAVLNRALSWTYAQTSRRHMDYIVNNWVNNTITRWDLIRPLLPFPPFHIDSGCGVGHGQSPSYYSEALFGWFIGWNFQDRVQLNNNREESIDSLKAHRSLPSGCTASLISDGNKNIRIISSEIAELRSHINPFAAKAVRKTMQDNLPGNPCAYWIDGKWNDDSVRDASYLTPETSEVNFLAYSGNTQAGFGNGRNTWWPLSASGSGIYRKYSQTFSSLLAKFRYWATIWERADTLGAVCHWAATHIRQTVEVRPTCYAQFTMSTARPIKLEKSFFGKAGSIVVAAKLNITNPFSAIGKFSGLYDAFTPDGETDMWAVSAARAGVRLREHRGTPGHYDVLYPGKTASVGYTDGVWNLCEEDWDGVLIPVARAWNETEVGEWSGAPTAETLLSEVIQNGGMDLHTAYSGGIEKNMRH